MIQLVDPDDIHSAADTWSGFIYQGKVALYHVLRLISEKDDIGELYLQLDSLEDFAIIRYDEDENLIPISLHQVKAMKSNLYSSYKEAFEKLEKRKTDHPCEGEAYFHLATENEWDKATLESSHSNIKVYDYNGNPFCKIEDLQIHIDEKIKLCLSKFGKEEFVTNYNYILNLCGELDDMITSQILAVHSCNHTKDGLSINQGAYYFTIPLKSFVEKIEANQQDLLFDKTFYYKRVVIDLNNHYQEFCLEFEDEINIDQRERLSKYLIFLNGLNESDFEEFLQKITPQRTIKFSTSQEYKHNSLQKDEIKKVFLNILHNVRNSDEETVNKIGWIDTESKRYFPSTIIVSDSDLMRQSISLEILDTALDTLVEVPFNTDFIITEGCNVVSIEEEANNSARINQLDINILNDSTSSEFNKITRWKNLSLIDLRQAKLKLNENNN